MQPSYCTNQKTCVGWVQKYFRDCLCNLNDEISFTFGFISLICWGVAEIPQIITNFRAKSSHGVSIVFLLTWVAGDVFNLVGCVLEPATLPTQYYTALLYTITTIILVLQSLYYDYIYKWSNRRQKINNIQETYEEEKQPLKPNEGHESGIAIKSVKNRVVSRPEYFYGSARSLAGNFTPPSQSYMRVAKSVPSAMGLDQDSSSEDEEHYVPIRTQPRLIPRSTGSYGTFLAAAINLPTQGNAMKVFYGRKLLSNENVTHSALGQWLGWCMTAIYCGGRIPQIWLNIKRGSVEGLNPFMFIFALIANSAYVGSILVRTTEWKSIKANLPWLLDAIVCVALDLFIILQYLNYRYRQKTTTVNDDYEDYKVETKTFVS